jgi:small subunit ribosomal protein S20
LQERGGILVLPQQRNHLPSEIADHPIGEDGLEAVADLGAIPVVVDCQQDEHAAVLALGACAPFIEQPIGEIVFGIAFQGMDGNHGDLGIGLLVEFLAERGQGLARAGIQDAGKVIDIALGSELFDLFCAHWKNGGQGQKQQKWRQERESGSNRRGAAHRPSLTNAHPSVTVSDSRHVEKEFQMAQGVATKVKKRKKSVLKRAAQAIKRSAVNRGNRTRVRSMIKALRGAIAAGDPKAAAAMLNATVSAIDRAVSKGVLEKNTANRYKSRLNVACNSMSAAGKA